VNGVGAVLIPKAAWTTRLQDYKEHAACLWSESVSIEVVRNILSIAHA